MSASASSAHHPAASSPRVSAKALAARQAAAIALLAPADEYFGPLKLSILGIRNTIHDLGARYDVNHAIWHQTYSSAQLTERAIHDWEKRYPHDGQVPKAIYLIQRLYTKVLSQEARDRASYTAKWMFSDYGQSPQGRQLKKTLAVEHLAPLPSPDDAAPASAAPGYPSEFGPNYKSDFGTPATSPSGAPAASPSGAPVAAPAPTPAPGS